MRIQPFPRAHGVALPRTTLLLALTALGGMHAGCTSITATQIEEEHAAFNTAVAEAMDQQLLLNIVRLWKCQSTQWMQVSSINTTAEYNLGIGGDASFRPGETVGGVAASGSYSYRPTLTFNPLEGEQLARELMSPVLIENMVNLASSGWPVSWLFFLIVDRCEALESFDISERFGLVSGDDQFGRLLELCDILEHGQRMSLLLSQIPVTWNMAPIPSGDVSADAIASARDASCRYVLREDGSYDYMSVEVAPVFMMYPTLEDEPLGSEFVELMRLDPDPNMYRVVSVDSPLIADVTISLQTRSLIAILRFLSYGVSDGPVEESLPSSSSAAEIYQGLSRSNRSDQATKGVVSRFFRVNRTADKPVRCSTAVRFEGWWYWIAEDDLITKQLFALVRDLYDLQVKSQPGGRPVLTIPVG